MTTLIQRTKSEIKNEFEKEIKKHGISLSVTDFLAMIEEISPAKSRSAIDAVLNFMKPWTQGMGLRVVRISESQVEIMIPGLARNKYQNRDIHIGIYVPAAIEAASLFWERHLTQEFFIDVQSVQIKKIVSVSSEARLRLEFDPTLRESLLAQWRQTLNYPFEMQFQIYDEADRLAAQLVLGMQVNLQTVLASSTV